MHKTSLYIEYSKYVDLANTYALCINSSSCSLDNPDSYTAGVELNHPGTAGVSCSLARPEHPSLPLAHCTLCEVVTLLEVKVAVGHQGAAMDHHLQGGAGAVQVGDAAERRWSRECKLGYTVLATHSS